MEVTKNIAIIGGGITGLATAHTIQTYARKNNLPLRFTLFESSARLGGKVSSEAAEGFVVEGGPDSFLLQKPWAAELALALGLESQLIGTNEKQRKLFVVNHGRLIPMPDGVMLIIPTRFMPFITSPLISWPGKIRMGMDLFIPRRKDDADESIGNFIRRRLGKEALNKLAAPLLSGIHVSDPEQQSLLGTFPRFRNIEKQHGSLIRGMLAQRRAAAQKNSKPRQEQDARPWKRSAFVSLKGGMAQLVEALEQALDGGELRTNCPVSQIRPQAGGGYQITTQDEETTQADAVVLATPAYVSAKLVESFSPTLSQALNTIRYVSTATVSLAYNRSEVGSVIDGVGFIIPRSENRFISACTISSTKFSSRAPQGQLLLRCFVGGPGREDDVFKSDAEIIANVRADLSDLAGVQAEPLLARVFRWNKGNAQYDVGHLERVRQMHALCAEFPGLYLTGSAYEGIGVPDCIHQGQQAAEKAIAFSNESLQESILSGQA